jgi:hypothetical protein
MTSILLHFKPESHGDWLAALTIVTTVVFFALPLLWQAASIYKHRFWVIASVLCLISFNMSPLAHISIMMEWPVDLICALVITAYIAYLVHFRRYRFDIGYARIRFLGVFWEQLNGVVVEKPICPKCFTTMAYAPNSSFDHVVWNCLNNCDLPTLEWNTANQQHPLNWLVAAAFNREFRRRNLEPKIKPTEGAAEVMTNV